MKGRLRQIIDYTSEGKPSAFAQTMGWKSQYVNSLLNTERGIGIKPTTAILERFPEINARWFLLGEGTMLSDLSASLRHYVFLLLSVEEGGSDLATGDLSRLSSEMKVALARLEGYFSATRKS